MRWFKYKISQGRVIIIYNFLNILIIVTTANIHVYLFRLIENGFRLILTVWPKLIDRRSFENSRERSNTVENVRIQSRTFEYIREQSKHSKTFKNSRIQSKTVENSRNIQKHLKTVENAVSLLTIFLNFIIAKITQLYVQH